MIGDLYINGTDAYTKGIVMGKEFIDTLRAPVAFKEDIENDSSIEHGKRVILSEYIDSREITLTFNIHGSDSASFAANEKWLLDNFYGRTLTIKVKGDESYYRLLYRSSVSYGRSKSVCVISAKFTEINPNDREETPKSGLFAV